MAVRIEKIIATALHEAHKRQVEEVIDTLEEGRRACTCGLLIDPGQGSIRFQGRLLESPGPGALGPR